MSDRAPRAAAHPSRRRTPWWRIVVALVVALAVQVPFVVGFRLALLGGANGANPEPEPTPSIEDEPQLVAVTEEEAPAPLEREPELEPEPQPEPEQEQEPDAAPLVELVVPDPVETVTPQPEAEPPPPPPDEDVNRLAVAQAESNDVEPVETNHRADRANTVAEETIAANTTLRDPGAPETGGDDDAPEGDDAGSETMEHGEDAPAEPEAVAEQSEQVDGAPDAESLEQPTPRPDDVEPMVAALEPDPVPDVEPVEAVEPTPTPDPAEVAPPPGTEGNEPPRRSGLSLQAQLEQAREAVEGNPDAAEAVANLATPSADDWVEVFGARDAQDRIRLEREACEASLVGDHRGEYERTQAALENHGVQARTGTETHLNARADSTAKALGAAYHAERLWLFLPSSDGLPEVGILSASRTAGKAGRLDVRDPLTGVQLALIRLSGKWQVLGQEVVGDLDDDGYPEVAVLRTEVDGDRVQVVIISTGPNGGYVRQAPMDAGFTPHKLFVISDVNGNGATEIVVFGINAAGKQKAQIKDSLTGKSIRSIYFPPHLEFADVAHSRDLNDNGSQELVVLGKKTDGSYRVTVKDTKTGRLIDRVTF